MDNNIKEAIKSYTDNIDTKQSQTTSQIRFSAILAGIFISIGGFVSVNVGMDLPIGLSKFLSGVIFSSALIMIVLLGLELFTGNILVTFRYLERFDIKSFLKLWCEVYVGNLFGCLITSALLRLSGLAVSIQSKLDTIATMKCSLPFHEAFIRGIFCNLLVCTAILVATEAKTVQGKIFGIMIPITVFIASGYEHSIANMFFITMSNVTIAQFLHNLIPVTLGNIIGGILLVIFLKRSKNV